MKKWVAIIILTPVLIAIFLGGFFGVNYLRVNKVSERVQWRITEYGVAYPIVVNDVLILNASRSDDRDECFCLYGLNKSTGEILWSTNDLAVPYIEKAKRLGTDPRTDMEVVAYIGDIVYANLRYWDKEDNLKYVLFAIRSNDGTVLWQADGVIDYDSFSKSVIETNQIFMGDNEGSLLALDSRTGKEMWHKKVYDGDYWDSNLFMYYENAIFVLNSSTECLIDYCYFPINANANEYYQIDAFSAETGELLWKSVRIYRGNGKYNIYNYRNFERIYAFDETLYVKSHAVIEDTDKLITAINTKTGEERWKLQFQDVAEFRIDASAENETYFLTRTYEGGPNDFHKLSGFTAVDKFTGKVIWQFNENALHGDLEYLISDSVIYIGAEDGYIFALDSHTGNIIWQAETGYFPIYFAVRGDSLVTVYEERFIASFDLKTGSKNWILDLDIDSYWYVLSDEILEIDDKYLYIAGNYQKKIYAVDLETGKILWSWEHFWPVRADLEINLVDDNYLYVEQNPRWSNWSKLFGEHWFFALKIKP